MSVRVKSYLAPRTERSRRKLRTLRSLITIQDGDDVFTWEGQRFNTLDDANAAIATNALRIAGRDYLPDDEIQTPDHY